MNKEELIQKIEGLIEELRPYLQADGGDLSFVELTNDNVIKIKLKGACGSCPYSKMTLKDGIEKAIQNVLPEIKAVEEA